MGTSATAPHVAGAAALILSANPSYNVSQVWDALTSSAIDIGTYEEDSIYGWARLHLVLTNLTSYQPSGWSDKIVVTNKTRCTSTACTDSIPLYTTDTLYTDWAVFNNGSAATPVAFYTQLYVDEVKTQLAD